jgi:hypothetical protein
MYPGAQLRVSRYLKKIVQNVPLLKRVFKGFNPMQKNNAVVG